MGFDLDAYCQAREPWTVTLDGGTHAAAWVSVEQVLDYHSQILLAAAPPEGLSPLERTRHARQAQLRARLARQRLLDALFPGRWWRRSAVARQLLRRPEDEQEAVLADFFAWWRGRHPPPPNRTSGTASPSSNARPSPNAAAPASS